MLKIRPWPANHVSVHPPLSQIRMGATLLIVRMIRGGVVVGMTGDERSGRAGGREGGGRPGAIRTRPLVLRVRVGLTPQAQGMFSKARGCFPRPGERFPRLGE